MKSEEWKTYRTRFLVTAKQLSSTLTFVDHLGRQHSGRKGDYLVESSDGVLSIAPRCIFEDIYVPMSQIDEREIDEPGINGPEIGEPETSMKKASLGAPGPDHRRFEALAIEEVKLADGQLAASRIRPPANAARILRQQESGRGRRKLPQPCGVRPPGPRLGLM